MNLQKIIDALNLKVLTKNIDFSEVSPTTGYASDLLSCVMAGAAHGSLWVTLQAHTNIVAVAALLELSAIIITDGATPDDATIQKANEENITLLSAKENTFFVVGKLWEMGIREK
ncbi:MAG: hypothetical protein LWX83_06355 [Anaerolineae bacterium]|nr:hypothetical protein [Anaerolineae bacterium]